MIKLFNYFRSSASFRVRIALHLKGLPFEYIPVHIAKGEHLKSPAFAALSQERLVPVMQEGDDVLSQSLAIMEYLDETHPEPPLLPADPLGRARVRAIALAIACDIHPLNNLRVLKYLVRELGASDEAKNTWYRHWVESGLAAVERQLTQTAGTGKFCHGDTPTLADCCLVPQVFNGQRFNCSFNHVPTVMRVFDECMKHEAFIQAQPSRCPDFEG